MANNTWTAPGINVNLEIKNRKVDAGPLKQFVPRLKDYCKNRRSINELKIALQNQKVFRKRAREEMPSFLQTLMNVVTWSTDLEHRLMIFFALFPTDFTVDGDGVTSTMQAAREAVQKHGTPVAMLQKFYVELGLRLVIYHGSLCRYVHTPSNWDRRKEKNTVLLNSWGNHVFTYDNGAVHGQYGEMEHEDWQGRYRITPPRAFYEHQLAALEQENRYLVSNTTPWNKEYRKG